jgi:hypothetical protein
MPLFQVRYELVFTREVEADSEDDARAQAMDDVPYPDVDEEAGEECNCGEVIVEELEDE